MNRPGGCGIGIRFIRADGKPSTCQPYEAPIELEGCKRLHCPHCLSHVPPGPNLPPADLAPIVVGTYRGKDPALMIWLTERTVEDLVLEVRERKLVHQSIRRAIVLGIFGTLVFVIGTLLIARAFHHDARVGTVAVPLYASVFTGLVYRTTSRRIREYKERFGRTWRDGLAAKAELNARYGRFGSAGTENRP